MRILTEEEMIMVSGSGGLDSPGKSDANYGGNRSRTSSSHSSSGGSGNSNRPSNSGWGATVGGTIGGVIGAKVAGGYGPIAAAGRAWGSVVGSGLGHLTEGGFVAGANKAIDKTLHDAQNAAGRAAATGSRWGGRN
ncbi:hypothetical protein Brsp01_36410 [Brucella sp. NBRC 12950]|nr:hypothetical protein Brsp01_36410 [Brucella sp. NBRC 12950]